MSVCGAALAPLSASQRTQQSAGACFSDEGREHILSAQKAKGIFLNDSMEERKGEEREERRERERRY